MLYKGTCFSRLLSCGKLSLVMHYRVKAFCMWLAVAKPAQTFGGYEACLDLHVADADLVSRLLQSVLILHSDH